MFFFGRKRGRFDSDSDSDRDPWDEDDSDEDSDCSDDSEREYKRREREERRQAKAPSPMQEKIKMKYSVSDDDSDTEYEEYDRGTYYTDKKSSIKIHCDWNIDGFADPDVHDVENFFLVSNLYSAGNFNHFQFFFIMEKLVGKADTHWGIYVNILSNIRSEASVKIKSYVVNHKNDTVYLNGPSKAKFPTKAGYRFLGSINKDRYIDDDYYQCSYMGEGTLDFRFKIEVNYKSCQIPNDLEKIFRGEKEQDVTLTVKGKNFKANKKLLTDRSPTFAKLFEKDDSNKLKIDNIEPDIMKQLLIFIYTNQAPKVISLTDKLSEAADKYKVKDLQVMCKKVKAAKKLNPQLK